MLTKTKDDIEILDLMYLTPNMQKLLIGARWWFETLGKDFVITSIFSDRENVKSKSTTHQDFRAVDIRSTNLNEFQIKEFIQFCEDNYSSIGAISASDGEVRPCVYHDAGTGSHFHLQVRRESLIAKAARLLA